MRFKPFIIFIIIFTIIYFAGFAIYDHFKNKKDEEKTIKKNYSLLNIEKLVKFATFYNVNITVDLNKLTLIYEDLRNLFSISISNYSTKYVISKEELIIIEKYLEYFGLVRSKSIHIGQDHITNLNSQEESLTLKYSLLFSNKYDYDTIRRNIGIGAEKEIETIMNCYLIPGVKMENNEIHYIGDLDE